MSRNKKKVLLLLLINHLAYAGGGRFDIPWINYEEFAMNHGKYLADRENINVYKKDGSLSGTIEKMPNFDGVHNEGNFALWDDPQIMAGAKHVGIRHNFNVASRHLRNDVNLYTGYQAANKDTEKKKFTEDAIAKYRVNVGHDWAIQRTDRILYDAKTYEIVEDINKVSTNDLIARLGGGVNDIITEDGLEKGSAPYGNLAGGLNLITNVFKNGGIFGPLETGIRIALEKDAKTALDISTNPGDSGSPSFWWDKNSKKWLFISSNHGGGTDSWGKWSYQIRNTKAYAKYKEGINDREITNANNVRFENNSLKIDAETRNFRDTNLEKRDGKGNLILTHEINVQDEALTMSDEVFRIKNQTFNQKGLNIDIVGENDSSLARLTFKDDAVIQGTGHLKTAGLVVEEGKTLTYKANLQEGNILRKIGKGTLKIEGASNNEGDINIGEGRLELANTAGYAAKNVRVAQGAKVKIQNATQLNGNNIYFGLRGGTLDLNGNNLSFSDIYHMDKGATIANESATKSTFTFKGGEDRVFLGSFKGKMDVNYDPSSNQKWSLRGEDTAIDGNLTVHKGRVSVEGDTLISGHEKNIKENEYNQASFKATNITLGENTGLDIKRAATVNSKIDVASTASVHVIAEGKVLVDKKADYKDAPSEQDKNRIHVNGEINFKSNASNKNLVFNIQENNEAYLEAKITGKTQLEKTGSGLAYLSSDENTFTGTVDIQAGKLKVKNEKTVTNLANSSITLANHSILEVENNTDFSGILNRMNTNANGVLSLGKDVSHLDAKYADFANLYLGSSKDISIGTVGAKIDDKIKILNLGGDNGTITLKGLEANTDEKTINIGDGINKGHVIIDKIVEANNFKINLNKGVSLKFNEVLGNKKFVGLQYGSATDYKTRNVVKEDSEGVLLVEATDNDLSNYANTYLGAGKGKTIALNSVGVRDQYKFSGEGTLNVNFALENKDLSVDAQYFEGGIVDITTANASYQGNVVVMGNKNAENKVKITLKINEENELGSNNLFEVKDGGF